jgi:hypothetical protein
VNPGRLEGKGCAYSLADSAVAKRRARRAAA